MQNDFEVNCKIWGMSDGKITELKLGEIIFSYSSPKEKATVETADITPPISHNKNKKNLRRGLNKPLLFMWIEKNNIKKFTLRKFLLDNPTYTGRYSLMQRYISKLIKDKKIIQVSSNVDNPYKDEFKVIGDV